MTFCIAAPNFELLIYIYIDTEMGVSWDYCNMDRNQWASVKKVKIKGVNNIKVKNIIQIGLHVLPKHIVQFYSFWQWLDD